MNSREEKEGEGETNTIDTRFASILFVMHFEIDYFTLDVVYVI